MRTIAAMREAVRQGFFPGSTPPYGFKANRVEVRPGLMRSVLAVDDHVMRKRRQVGKISQDHF